VLQQIAFDLGQAEQFIEVITGNAASPVVLQFADDRETKRKELARVHIGPIRALADIVQKLNSVGAAVWMQINAGRRGKSNVTAARACYIDDDGKCPLPPLLRLPPSLTVSSSSAARNRHCYWLLRPDQSLEDWPRIQRHLALFYQTDKSIINLDRVMRLPGTFNWKYGEPQPVRIVSVGGPARYGYDQILSNHPLPEAALDEIRTDDEIRPTEKHTDAAQAMIRRIGFWLTTRGVGNDMIGPVTIRLHSCVFNPTHKNKLMIRVQSRGGIWAGCWHDSCGGNTNRWSEVKDKIGGWAADGAPFSRGDDLEVARRLLSDLTGRSEEAVAGDLGQLWQYQPTTGLWKSFDEGELYRAVAGYAGSAVGEKRTLKMSHGTVLACVASAKALASQGAFFDEAPPGVAFTNGVLAATPAGAAFVPHEAENRLLTGLPFAYDSTARCDRWREFLADCFEGDEDAAQKIDLLQEFTGACLMGLAPRYQKALVLLGEQGDNGKSVILRVVGSMFPRVATSAVPPQQWGHEYARARLAGVRINVVAEMPEADILSGDAFKAMIAGDTVLARHPHERPFEHAPIAGHFLSANAMPGTSDHTNSFFKRIMILVFNQSFPVGHPKRDVNLIEKLLPEMPGIAAWAAEGASRLLAVGSYSVPESQNAAQAQWRVESDAVQSFLAECCEIDRGSSCNATVLYETFTAWGRANGHRQMTQTSFGRRLRRLRIGKAHTFSGAIYYLRIIKQINSFYLGS
jgi:P4 family phage/plasmid primase-like protien